MSQFTDYAENKLIDMIRGQTWTLGGSLYVGLASSAIDSTNTELSGTGYARVAVSRALASWAGTQGPGTTTASSGSSHTSSNNVVVSFGTAGSAWGTASYAVIYDSLTNGNAIAYLQLGNAIVIGNGDPVSLSIGELEFSLGTSGGCSDYLSNKLIDFIFRGQSFSFTNLDVALYTAAPHNGGGGTEVAGSGYARVGVTGGLTQWAGAQGAGTTTASTGGSGKTSNNTAVNFPSPSGSWGSVGWVGLHASGSGNLLFWAPLNSPRFVPAGGAAPSFPPAALTVTFA